jgi:hypothetical protein
MITSGLAATGLLLSNRPAGAFSLAHLFLIFGTRHQSFLKHPQHHLLSLAIKEWAQQKPNEPTDSPHPAKSLPVVIVLKANHPNVCDIFLLTIFRTAREMYVVANLVEQYIGDLALADQRDS